MTSVLAEKTCTPCSGGTPPLTAEEAEAYRVQAPEWLLQDEARRIERTYRFRNFTDAFAFVRGAGELAETEFHHPDVSFGWGYTTVSLRTKKIGGVCGSAARSSEPSGVPQPRRNPSEPDSRPE